MSTPDTPRIEVTGAAFGYDRNRPVISNVNLSLQPGDYLGILGPNGAGKTTLLRGILGLLLPSNGRVSRHGMTLGYVPQREALDPVFPLTVEEVVQMGALGRLSRTRRLSVEDRELALTCLDRVRLRERRKDKFESLSGGQRQRTLVARALMQRPNLLLLDEPTSGVDRPTQEAIFDLLGKMRQSENMGILLVSHELALTRRHVDEILWVAEGRVERGAADQMAASPGLEQMFGSAAGGGIVGGE